MNQATHNRSENQEALSAEQSLVPATALTAREILVAARALIESPNRWMQNYYARDADGNETSWSSRTACQFCADGALMHATGDADDSYYTALAILEGVTNVHSITTWNDKPGRTHAEVLAAFDKAIAATGAA